jgi:hypothetical protein
MQTRKILTLRNCQFLTVPDSVSLPEEIEIMPEAVHKGEMEENACSIMHKGEHNGKSLKRKATVLEKSASENKPYKTRGICTNYHKLHDLFEGEDNKPFNYSMYLSDKFAGTIMVRDEYHSLCKAKASPDWLDW